MRDHTLWYTAGGNAKVNNAYEGNSEIICKNKMLIYLFFDNSITKNLSKIYWENVKQFMAMIIHYSIYSDSKRLKFNVHW